MKAKHIWQALAVAGLMASQSRAVEFFMPVPYLGGSFVFRTEFVRQDLGKSDVDFTFVAEGRSGLGLPAASYTVLPGPSTNSNHPLLTDNYTRDYRRPPDRSDPKYFLPGSGLVRMAGEQGLVAAETAVVIGGDPATAWELPLLTADDAFTPGATVYVQNLLKDATVSSQLSIFNLDGSPATCRARLLSATGAVLDERANIAVPSIGAVRLADIMKKVTVAAASGLNAAVTCDHPFYALGSFPAKAVGDIRVLFPATELATAGTAITLAADPAFKVTQKTSVRYYNLPLVPDERYRSITIDFDVIAANPSNDAFYRGLLGMWRDEPGQRFAKTLFFGVNERFDRSKLLVDLGTPYIEIMTKKGNAAFVNQRSYHFRIEVNSDLQSFHQRVTTAGGALLADMQSGLFNSDLVARNGHTLIVGIGLPGIGDGAYSPPYGFKFSNILIKGYR